MAQSAVAQLVERQAGDRTVASSRLNAGVVSVLCPLASIGYYTMFCIAYKIHN